MGRGKSGCDYGVATNSLSSSDEESALFGNSARLPENPDAYCSKTSFAATMVLLWIVTVSSTFCA
jgi:hypothetical protein